MLEQFSQYLVQAPIAVILFAYIYFSDKQKAKMIDGYKETTDRLITLVENLTSKK